MITIRDSLVRSRRRIALVTFAGFVVFAGWFVARYAAILRGLSPPERPPLMVFLGFGIAVIGFICSLFFVRCPNCRGNLGGPLSSVSGPFSVSKQVRYCLYCGVEFDSPLPLTPNQPLEPTTGMHGRGEEKASAARRGSTA
jgi:hypothetical protein